MKDVLYLAWRYLRYNRVKTIVLTASVSLILFLPAALQVLVREAADLLTSRADETPLLVGARGSSVDLTLAALYFREPTLPPMRYGEVERVTRTELALAIPLHLRFTAGGQRIVGTSSDYFDFRKLELAEGRPMAILGECVLGAKAAARLGARVGDSVISTPAGAFDVGGSFPLKMSVVGVLARADSPDDEAVFVDVKTTWVIEGVAHGHTDVTSGSAAADGVSSRDEDNVVANASVLPYTEITPENIDSFHFHGEPDAFPVDAAVVVPRDRRSGIVLRGRYGDGDAVQVLDPRAVVDDLVETMFSVRDAVLVVSLGLGLATITTAALVFALSIRLRQRELATMRKIGSPRGRLIAILATEILLVVLASVAMASALTFVVGRYGATVLQLAAG